jgi:hypothetical protein
MKHNRNRSMYVLPLDLLGAHNPNIHYWRCERRVIRYWRHAFWLLELGYLPSIYFATAGSEKSDHSRNERFNRVSAPNFIPEPCKRLPLDEAPRSFPFGTSLPQERHRQYRSKGIPALGTDAVESDCSPA